MPIYAYRCEACGFSKDALQKVSDAPLTQCPSCGQPTFKKQLTAAGFQLKGTGWYATDFKSGTTVGKPGPASTETADKPAATGNDSAATGAAPASTPAAPAAASDSGKSSAS